MQAKDYFIIIPDHALNKVGNGLSQGAFIMFAKLVQLTRFENTATVQISHADLGEKLGVSARTARTYTSELVAAGLIVKHAQKDPSNPAYNLENLYQVVVQNISVGTEVNFHRGAEENFLPPIKDIKEKKKSANAPAFEALWAQYPAQRKGSKKTAESRYKTAINSHSPEELTQLMAHYIERRERAERSGEFIPTYPHLSTWLSQERWNDFGSVDEPAAALEPTLEEVTRALGRDTWKMPDPPEDLSLSEVMAWESGQKKNRWEQRKQEYLEVKNGKH